VGYTPPTKTYTLKFEDHPGLIVKCGSVPLGEINRLSGLVARLTGIDPADKDFDEALDALAALDEVYVGFAGAIKEWNLEIPEGVPVPTTAEGLASLDPEFGFELLTAWLTAAGGVKAPLGVRSNSGGPSLVGSLPMEPKSSSLTN
jgi:hypothetical protein